MSIQNKDLTDEEKYFLLQLSYVDLVSAVDYQDNNLTIIQALNRARIELAEDKDQIERIEALIKSYPEITRKHEGLKDIRIIGYENHNRNGDTTHDTRSGFVGYALEDSNGNRGFLFRGSETESWVDWTDNAESGIKGESTQVRQANAFFEKYSTDEHGRRMEDISYSLYGHSKGNNLATEVFVNHLDLDVNAYSVNGQPIYWFDLTDEQKAAIRGDRYQFIVHEGDFVSGLGYVDYVDTVVNLKDSFFERIRSSGWGGFMDPHALTVIEFDESGGFASTQNPDTVRRQIANAGVTAAIMAIRNIPKLFTDEADFEMWRELGKTGYDFVIDSAKVLWKAVWNSEPVEGIKSFVRNTLKDIGTWFDRHWNRFSEWFDSFTNNVRSFFSGFFGGSSGTALPQTMVVDTGMLRMLAGRLQTVQAKIDSVDRRLDRLAALADLEDKFSYYWLGLKVGYDYELKRCVDYLHQSADRIDDCERMIVQRAYS
ncbi:DUF6792 domain-containing protein [Paenibacillaceae bacterium WGS1546]|uniref:DUF6792 domain-containing protein n=1 Tax=Cohnella sp. WGS1546 TaxID=3366810 RepID=UPI00372D8494